MKFLSTRTNRKKLPDSYAVSGIYRIQCVANGKFYIGSTGISIRKRWGQHVSALSSGKHANPNLQASWNKYGESAFIFGVVEYCAPEVSIERESYYIKTWSPLFNYAKAANPRLGVKLTAEQRAYISKRKKELMTDEIREKCRQAASGHDKSKQLAAMRKVNLTKVIDQDGQVWDSVKEVAAHYGVAPCIISHNLKGRTKLVRGQYKFRYWEE